MPKIKVNGVSIAYEVAGEGPPIVWTPGGWIPREPFTYVFAGRLSASHKVLTWDRRNCGASDLAVEDAESEWHLWADDLHALLQEARRRRVPITRQVLQEHGAKTPLFDGVELWFERINRYARERDLELQHYVVSSGNEEMILGSSIAYHFTRVFACRYIYDASGHAIWPAAAVNYTTKTQYLFRINKGVDTYWDDERVNRWVPMNERYLPFCRMIYLGDGDTDVPSMKMVRHQGGHSVGVFDPAAWDSPDPTIRATFKEKAYNLIAEDRAHFVVPADYTEGSQLDVTLKGILGRIARDAGWRG